MLLVRYSSLLNLGEKKHLRGAWFWMVCVTCFCHVLSFSSKATLKNDISRTPQLIKPPLGGSAAYLRPEEGLVCPNCCHFFPKIYYVSLAASWHSCYIQTWHFNKGFFKTERKQGMSINWNNFIQMSGAGGICASGGLVEDGTLWLTVSSNPSQPASNKSEILPFVVLYKPKPNILVIS